MKRYELRRGKLHEHDAGEWVRWDEVRTEREELREKSGCPPDWSLKPWLQLLYGMFSKAAEGDQDERQ